MLLGVNSVKAILASNEWWFKKLSIFSVLSSVETSINNFFARKKTSLLRSLFIWGEQTISLKRYLRKILSLVKVQFQKIVGKQFCALEEWIIASLWLEISEKFPDDNLVLYSLTKIFTISTVLIWCGSRYRQESNLRVQSPSDFQSIFPIARIRLPRWINLFHSIHTAHFI